MRSELSYLSLFQDCDGIRVVYGRETMSNDNAGSSLSGFVQGFLNNLFTLGVESRSSFVKKEDFWFADESSSDSHTLLLSSTELCAFSSNIGVIALSMSVNNHCSNVLYSQSTTHNNNIICGSQVLTTFFDVHVFVPMS